MIKQLIERFQKEKNIREINNYSSEIDDEYKLYDKLEEEIKHVLKTINYKEQDYNTLTFNLIRRIRGIRLFHKE